MHSVRLLLLLVFALLSSCAKQGIRHDVKQMMSRPIVMPDELERVLADTVIACILEFPLQSDPLRPFAN